MNLRVESVPVRFERPVGETKLQAVVEGTLTLPATFPEIGRIVRVTAVPRVTSTEVDTDQVVLEGTLDVSLMYAASVEEDVEAIGDEVDEEAEGLPAEPLYRSLWRRVLPFEGVVDLVGARAGMEVVAHVRVDEIRTAPARGGRELEVDAVLSALVRCVESVTVAIPEPVNDGAPLKRESVIVNTCSARLRHEASLQGRLQLPEDAARFSRALDVDAVVTIERVAVDDGVAQAEGVIDVHLAYVPADGADGPVAFSSWEGGIPFTHRFHDDALEAGQSGQVTARVLSVDVESVDGGRGVEVFADVELTLQTGGPRSVEFVADVVEDDREGSVEVRTETFTLETVAGHGEHVAQVSGTVDVGDDHPPIDRLLAHEAHAIADEVLVLGDRVSVIGHVDVALLYTARDSAVENQVYFAEWRGALPLEIEIPVRGVHPPMRATVDLDVIDIEPDLLNRETVEWRGRVQATAVVEETKHVEAVVEAVFVPPPEENPPTYTFVVVEPGETLWKIARRYYSSVEAILAANPQLGGAEADLVPGSKICVPRYRRQALVPLNGGLQANNNGGLPDHPKAAGNGYA